MSSGLKKIRWKLIRGKVDNKDNYCDRIMVIDSFSDEIFLIDLSDNVKREAYKERILVLNFF